jgi:hypothetical protein
MNRFRIALAMCVGGPGGQSQAQQAAAPAPAPNPAAAQQPDDGAPGASADRPTQQAVFAEATQRQAAGRERPAGAGPSTSQDGGAGPSTSATPAATARTTSTAAGPSTGMQSLNTFLGEHGGAQALKKLPKSQPKLAAAGPSTSQRGAEDGPPAGPAAAPVPTLTPDRPSLNAMLQEHGRRGVRDEVEAQRLPDQAAAGPSTSRQGTEAGPTAAGDSTSAADRPSLPEMLARHGRRGVRDGADS